MNALKLGDVIEVDDRNYRFGIGPIILRVTMLGSQKRGIDGEWVDLEGLELRRDGSQIGQQPRPVSVRVPGVRLWPVPYAWS